MRVFLFHDGVRCAELPDEHPIHRRLAALSTDHAVELFACTAACQRRGVTPRAPFEEVGIGQLIEAATSADRHVTFLA